LRPGPGRTEIELGPLEPNAVQQLASLAGDGADDRAAAAIERSGGNPLFVIELSRSISVAPDLPVTIQAAIAARIDELPPSDRTLLQAASVAGEAFNVAAAALLGERPPMEVAAALGQMVHLGFVTHTESGYRFHHALVHDVAYGRLPVGQRMALHQRYAEEGVGRDDLEALAHHWWEAVRPPDGAWVWADSGRLETFRRRAFRVQLDAGVRLEQRNAYEEALEVYLRALELADMTGERAEAEAAIGRGYARQGRGDDAWQHRLASIELYRQTDDGPPAQVFADMLEIATFNWGYFHELPTDESVLALLDEGIAISRATHDDVALARLLAERAAYTNDVSGTDDIHRLAASKDGVAFGDAAQRLGTVYVWAGRIADAVSTYETVLDGLVPAGSAINVPEALVWYTNAAFLAGDLMKADALARRLNQEATHRSIHTRGHAFAATALVQLGRGDWQGLQTTAGELRSLVDANPDVPMCILGAAAVGYGAAGTILNGGTLPSDIDQRAERMVDDSERVRAAATMLPKAMSGDAGAIERGLTGYEPGLRLWDKFRVWDVSDIVPGIVLTMFQRWDAIPPILDRMDRFAGKGARLAGATAAAIREEIAVANGGSGPSHDELRDLGYSGISALLRYRPRAN